MNPNKSDRSRMGADITRSRARGAAPTAEKKRRGLFLLMDVFLLIGILGVIFLLLLAFTPFSLFGDDAEPRQIFYTVELSGVDQRFVSAFREGDTVVDADTGSAMGEIVQIKIRDYEAYTDVPTPEIDPEFGKHVVRKQTNENLKTVSVVIRVTADYTEGVGYHAEECRVAVGKEYQLRFPSYTGRGSCVALEHMAKEGEVTD
ncbi:MAG: DUF4330 domain-containing protein [Clostridia bacterium]|nr:DUF4330 domain-containing protein [Clostridia bacterium]